MAHDPSRKSITQPLAIRPRESHTAAAAGSLEPGHQPSSRLLDLVAHQPVGLFLLDVSGVILEVGGAWEDVTGLHAADSLGLSMLRLLQIPADDGADGLLGEYGSSDTSVLRTMNCEVRVRVRWQRSNDYIAGNIELARPQVEAGFKAETQLKNVEAALDETLRCLGLTLDVWKGEHVERLVTYSVRLAEAMGLSSVDLQVVRWGAALHDVGKARVPSGILFKPGPLTPEERVVVQQHPRWGLEVLDQLSFLPAGVRDVVLHHHERWDGLGYPVGLSGEGIPLVARIVSVTDVFDALTSERSYKRAWDYHDAADYLRAECWKQFDARIVDVFLREVLRLF